MDWSYTPYVLLYLFVFALASGKLFGEFVAHGVGPRIKGKTQGAVTVVLFPLLAGIVAGTRGETFGLDYRNYLEFYDYVRFVDNFSDVSSGFELGWRVLNYAGATAALPPGLFFGAVTGATWALIVMGGRLFPNLTAPILLYSFSFGEYYSSLNTMRQAVAAATCFYGLSFLIERKQVHFAVASAVALTFHTVALVSVPIYLLSYLPYIPRFALLCAIGSILAAGMFDFGIVDVILRIVSGHIEILDRYFIYLQREDLRGQTGELGTLLGFYMKGLFYIWIAWRSRVFMPSMPNLNVLGNMFVVYFLISNLFLGVPLIGRIGGMFFVAVPVMAAATIYTSRTSIDRAVSVGFLAGFVAYFLSATKKFIESAL